jgi:hypothetical protein
MSSNDCQNRTVGMFCNVTVMIRTCGGPFGVPSRPITCGPCRASNDRTIIRTSNASLCPAPCCCNPVRIIRPCSKHRTRGRLLLWPTAATTIIIIARQQRHICFGPIVAAYETSLLVQSESLLVEKCVGRSRRCAHLAVAPLMAAAATAAPTREGRTLMPQQTTITMQHNVLMFGHAVADYHEQCSLGMATWGLVWSLRQQAALLVEWHQHGQQKKNNKSSSRLHTLRNHLDFCLTGRQRSSSNGSSGGGLLLYLGETPVPPPKAEHLTLINHPEGIPPHDLFDAILAELQHLTCSPS